MKKKSESTMDAIRLMLTVVTLILSLTALIITVKSLRSDKIAVVEDDDFEEWDDLD